MQGDENLAQLGNLTFENWGRLVGLELMLRALYTKWALEQNDPLAFLEGQQAALIQSMIQASRPDDAVEALLIQHAETQIDETFKNVRTRIENASKR